MAQIDKVISKQTPTLLDASKANELIGFVNGLLGSKGDNDIDVTVEDSGRLVISLKEGLSGGLPEGFEEETLDVVEDDNTAGQRVFLTKEVT